MWYRCINIYHQIRIGKQTLERLPLGRGEDGEERGRLEEEELRLVSTMFPLDQIQRELQRYEEVNGYTDVEREGEDEREREEGE